MQTMTRNFTRAGIVAVIAAVALSGCQSGAPDAASPLSTATSVPTSSAPAVDPLTTVTSLTVGPEALLLQGDTDAASVTLSYNDPVDAVVADLSVAFGADPVVDKHDGGLESPPGVGYLWEGFLLNDFLPAEGYFPEYANFSVSVTAPTTGEVALTSPGGFAIGDDLRAAATTLGVTVDTTFESVGSIFYFELGPELDTSPGENTSYPNAFAVSVTASTATGAIDSIRSSGNPSFWVH